jgi:hypothetical protein
MDTLNHLQKSAMRVIEEYAASRNTAPDIETELIFDTKNNHYQLVTVGWQNGKRVHGIVLHLDIRDGKIWVQHNGTEVDIAECLVETGISKDEIVLGFHTPFLRKFTEYAIG